MTGATAGELTLRLRREPCIPEEYGITSSKASVEGAWQTTVLEASGIAGDMFWQYGNTLSTGQTVDDGYPIFYGTSGYTSLVTNHVAAIG
jgi:mannan endo-1,4-beta-mannosidase